AAPKESVSFLQQRLQPVKVDPQRVAQLIEDLDSPKFRVRQQATEELEYLGRFAEEAMKKALAAKPGVEVTLRLELLLKKLAPPVTNVAKNGGPGMMGAGAKRVPPAPAKPAPQQADPKAKPAQPGATPPAQPNGQPVP